MIATHTGALTMSAIRRQSTTSPTPALMIKYRLRRRLTSCSSASPWTSSSSSSSATAGARSAAPEGVDVLVRRVRRRVVLRVVRRRRATLVLDRVGVRLVALVLGSLHAAVLPGRRRLQPSRPEAAGQGFEPR